MNLILTVLWGLLALVVLALLVWRKVVARGEDDTLHVLDGGAVQQTAAQSAMAHKLEAIDKWGKTLTVIAVVYGLVLAAIYVLQAWSQNSRVGV